MNPSGGQTSNSPIKEVFPSLNVTDDILKMLQNKNPDDNEK